MSATDKSQKRVALSLSLSVSDEQGQMSDTTHTLHNLPYPGAVYIQGRLLDLFTELHKWGKALARGEEPKLSI